jgi:IclR family acetate operon transcriptional repressor
MTRPARLRPSAPTAGPRARRRRRAAPTSGSVRVVDRVVQLLEVLSETEHGYGVTEIAGRLHLGKSTTHRLLTSLARAEVVRADSRQRLYRLGYRLLRWTSGWLDRMDVRTLALPHLRQLREKCQETVSLNLREDNARVAVERLETSQEVRFVAEVGKPLPLHVGASGKAILAFLPPSEIDRVLGAASLPPSRDRELRRALADIRRSGAAVSFGERLAGSGAVSAPLFNHEARVIGSVSILSVAARLSPDTVRSYSELVRHAAGEISRDLGCREAMTPAGRLAGGGRR